MHPAKPDRATVAVTAYTDLGQPLVIGMKFVATGPVNDSLCLGVTTSGTSGWMNFSFAPFSGRCFIEHESKGTLQTQAMPCVSEVFEGHVWIHVTDEGELRFLRKLKDGELEDTGFIVLQKLPICVQSILGNIDIWLNDLQATIDVSIEHSGCGFPTNMLVPIDGKGEIETTWMLHRGGTETSTETDTESETEMEP